MAGLTKNGYIVLNDYDKVRIDDKDLGNKTRSYIMGCLSNAMNSLIEPDRPDVLIQYNENNISIDFSGVDDKSINYHAILCTVNHLVNRNKTLMSQGSMVYPFIKDMDKYGTIYLSISSNVSSDRTKLTIDNFVSRIIDELNKIASDLVLTSFQDGESDSFKFVPALLKEEDRYETTTA